ncbi:hypothetical protein HY492_04055 [Candidatus Woesearchaeota archaeon]|nr:hypothetical protein [Candidatus Woesearchaeota archaeon]
MDRQHILEDIEKFDEEMGREHLAHARGMKDEVNFSAIYSRHEHLFTLENIRLVRALLKDAKLPDTQRRNLLLFDYLVGSRIGNELKALSDKASNYEAKATIKVGGKKIPYRQASIVVMNEPNRKQRQKIVDALKVPKRVLTKFSEEALEKEYKLLKELSGKDYVEYVEWIKQFDLRKFGKVLEGFLAQSNKMYRAKLATVMTSMKVPLNDIQKHDLGFYLRAHKFDAYFPKKRLIPTLHATLSGMGFSLPKQKNITLDADERPTKVPRAFCMPLLIPHEIYLVLKPHGGQEDYQTILHEAGHSEHFANTKDDLPYELKHMGSHSVSETYSFLFEYLTMDPLWLKKFIRMSAKKEQEFLDFQKFTKLFFVRRYAGKVLYELKFHGNDVRRLDDDFQPLRETYASKAAMYADILTKTTGAIYKEDDYLLDMDNAFYSADYVRAWMFEVQVRNYLKEHYGAWFANKKSGAFLKKMWSTGSAGRNQEELAKLINAPSVDPQYLFHEVL